ncbi:NAD-dependent epimerase/dehydratase family protein [Chryseobacterium aureum]|uniref:NAD-dependent epimerase/dehydratase family protein n=1 Tax=Chryseobacterium aureum TaxID=2497456 RepID=UPI000F894A5F|nr:NAD-dependent epimerase/dehydratase family protein [Chryseobacterium aureum]
MIIGNGILANAVRSYDREDVLFFASGVSNSLEKNPTEFEREIRLLKSALEEFPDKKLIYFSTCSIYDPTKKDSPYVIHKLNAEKLIADTCKNFIIFRIGNAVGRGGNPNTLINFLKNAILSENKFILHNNAKRILIGTDDIALFIKQYIDEFNNEIINLTYPYQYSLPEILSQLEEYLDKKAVYENVDEGSYYTIEFNPITETFFTGISSEDYLRRLFSAYL